MSFQALGWAASAKVKRASDKLVLLGLADRHHTDSGTAYPSLAWLCEFSSLDRKTVISALTRLEGVGLIADSGQRVGKTGQIKAYSLSINSPEKGTVKTEPFQPKDAVFSDKSSENGTRRLSGRQGSEAKASSPKSRAKFPAPHGVSKTVWSDFLASPKRRKAGMSDTAYAGINKNLKELAEHGYPPGEMMALAVERGWTTVKLEWVTNDGRSNTNTMGRHQPSDGLSPTTRAAIAVFGPSH